MEYVATITEGAGVNPTASGSLEIRAMSTDSGGVVDHGVQARIDLFETLTDRHNSSAVRGMGWQRVGSWSEDGAEGARVWTATVAPATS